MALVRWLRVELERDDRGLELSLSDARGRTAPIVSVRLTPGAAVTLAAVLSGGSALPLDTLAMAQIHGSLEIENDDG